VVVDLGGKTEGRFRRGITDTEIPRPEPNSTIEVQRTGSTRTVSRPVVPEVLRRDVGEDRRAFKAKETGYRQGVDRIRAAWWWISAYARSAGSQYDLRPRRPGRPDRHGNAGAHHEAEPPRGNVVVSRARCWKKNCMPSAPR